jgi:uncharacterized protein (DUF1697 family)
MDALRKSYESLGFHDVVAYLQSGNIIFSTKQTAPEETAPEEAVTEKTAPEEAVTEKTAPEETVAVELAHAISRQIEKDFGFDVPVIVLSANQLNEVIENNPFAKDSTKDKTFLHVTFLSSLPGNVNIHALEEKKQGDEEVSLVGNAVYLYSPHGYGRTKLTNNFLETKLKVTATTRNWKTTNELSRIARSGL